MLSLFSLRADEQVAQVAAARAAGKPAPNFTSVGSSSSAAPAAPAAPAASRSDGERDRRDTFRGDRGGASHSAGVGVGVGIAEDRYASTHNSAFAPRRNYLDRDVPTPRRGGGERANTNANANANANANSGGPGDRAVTDDRQRGERREGDDNDWNAARERYQQSGAMEEDLEAHKRQQRAERDRDRDRPDMYRQDRDRDRDRDRPEWNREAARGRGGRMPFRGSRDDREDRPQAQFRNRSRSPR